MLAPLASLALISGGRLALTAPLAGAASPASPLTESALFAHPSVASARARATAALDAELRSLRDSLSRVSKRAE
jgi:hypothetical protein